MAEREIAPYDVLPTIRMRLEEAHITQKELAAILDISPQYLSDMLAGRRAPSHRLLIWAGVRWEQRVYAYTGDSWLRNRPIVEGALREETKNG